MPSQNVGALHKVARSRIDRWCHVLLLLFPQPTTVPSWPSESHSMMITEKSTYLSGDLLRAAGRGGAGLAVRRSYAAHGSLCHGVLRSPQSEHFPPEVGVEAVVEDVGVASERLV